MYGTRKEITHELKRLFAADEPLALLAWTTESVKAMTQSHGITDIEAGSILVSIGNMLMQEYQQKGVSSSTVFDLLTEVRTEGRRVNVPANILKKLALFAEKALEIERCVAQGDRVSLPESVVQGKAALVKLNALLEA